jgi:hypothetical protein
MSPLNTTALIGLILILASAWAETPQGTSGNATPAGTEPNGDTATELWDKSRAAADEWWRRSQDAAGSWWERSQETAEDLWRYSQETADEAWEGTRDYLDPSPKDRFGQVWDGVLPTLEEALALEERHAELPKSAWFGDDQRSNRDAINRLLDQAVAILSVSNAQHYRKRIRVLLGEITKAREDIADYRRRRVSAPTKSLVKQTVSDLDEAIAERAADIDRYEAELAHIKRAFSADLRAMGLALSDEQVNFLLSTVVGDNLIDLGIVFDNVKAITVQLEQLVEDSGEDLPSARRYYGMYVILLQSLHQMHLQVEHAISGRYIPQIDAIIARARELAAETRSLMRQSPEKQALLTSNLEAQGLTIQTARVYREYLQEQGKQVAAARVELEKDIATAWNTYETVRVSGELADLVKSSRDLLNGLLNRQVPALRPFENIEMQREFEKLTAQLRSAEGR